MHSKTEWAFLPLSFLLKEIVYFYFWLCCIFIAAQAFLWSWQAWATL